MKKFILMMTLFMGLAVSASAQTALVDNGTAKDNWYIGGGVGTNVWNDATSWTLFNAKSNVVDGVTNSWWRTQPLNINVTVGKMLTPYFGLEADYDAIFNLRGESPFLDGHNLTANLVVNLTNVFGGYNGKRRVFEIEAIGGGGWFHNYAKHLSDGTPTDPNALSVRGAVRGNVNVCKNLAITITPEYIWLPKSVASSVNSKSLVNLSVGVKYRIPGKRSNFPVKKLYDPAEVKALSHEISILKSANETLANANAELSKSNADLAATIKRLMEEGGKAVVETKSCGIVLFEQGKSNANEIMIDRVIKGLKESSGTIVLTGTTSPEGSEFVNKRLGIKRAEAVKAALIAKGIDESRITMKNNYANQRSVVITVE